MATAVRRDHHQLAAVWDRPASGLDQPLGPICVATAAVSALLFWLVHRVLIDDAYITLSYARNLAFHLHWGLIPQESANSETSPLFVILIGAATAVVRNTVLGLGIVVVGTSVAMAAWLTRAGAALRLPTSSVVLATALVVCNPWLLAVTGMETPLLAALLAGMLCAVVRRRPTEFGVLAGLCLLARLDLVIFVVVLGLSSSAIRRHAGRVVLLMVVVSAPWFVWSWFHFGSAIPDTFVIKTLQHGFGTYVFTNGPFLYLKHHATVTVVSFLAALLGAATIVVWIVMRVRARRDDDARFDPVVALGIGGLVYYVAYSALDISPYPWYYGPVLVALSITLALLLPRVVARTGRRATRSARSGVVVSTLLAAIVVTEVVVVLANGIPWTGTVPVYTNWAAPADYTRIGKQLHGIVGNTTVVGFGEIGTLAYFCRCAIVDEFSDRGRLVPRIEYRIARAEPVLGFLLATNFRDLDRTKLPRPADYRLLLTGGRAHGPDSWNLALSPDRHIALEPSAAHASDVASLLRQMTPSLPSRDALVLIGARGADSDWRDAVARALRQRHVRVRLDPSDELPWQRNRSYRGERVGEVFTLASGSAIDGMLAHAGTHLVAYVGNGPFSQRAVVKAQIAQLAASFKAGRLTWPQLVAAADAATRSLGADVAVIATT